jgi:predicted acetyltransferase
MNRDQQWWRRSLGLGDGSPSREPAHNWFLHEGEDGVDGLLGWSGQGEESLLSPRQSVQVSALFTSSEAAYRDIWSYLTGLDMVDRVTLPLRPVSEPVRWLLQDGRALETTCLVDFLWLRLLDVPAALRARTYSATDELILEVADSYADGFAQGRYVLAAGPEHVECEPTEREPDLEIDQRALASIYLGGFRLEELLPAGVAREFTPAALTRLDRMFACARPPWNATSF